MTNQDIGYLCVSRNHPDVTYLGRHNAYLHHAMYGGSVHHYPTFQRFDADYCSEIFYGEIVRQYQPNVLKLKEGVTNEYT